MLLAAWYPFPSSCLGRLTLVVASPKLPYGQMSLGVAGRKRMHQEILPFHLGLQKPHSKHLPCTSCVLCLLLCVLLMTHTLSKKTVRVFPSNSAGGFCLQPGLSEIQWWQTWQTGDGFGAVVGLNFKHLGCHPSFLPRSPLGGKRNKQHWPTPTHPDFCGLLLYLVRDVRQGRCQPVHPSAASAVNKRFYSSTSIVHSGTRR